MMSCQSFDRRFDQELKSRCRCGRVAREPKERCAINLSEQHRFSRFDGNFPEDSFEIALFQSRVDMIPLTHRDSPCRDNQVCIKGLINKSTKGLRIILTDAQT